MYKATHPLVRSRWVLVRDPEGKLLIVPLFSTNPRHDPVYIIETFVLRFGIEAFFEESRAHLGMETKCQSDKAIIRSTPLIFGLFSIICLIALKLQETVEFSVQSSAWYAKNIDEATFSDIIAYVRRFCWASRYLMDWTCRDETIKFQTKDLNNLLNLLAISP